MDYNTKIEWLWKVEEEIEGTNKPQNIVILKINVVNQVRKMSIWKSTGLDGFHGLWFYKFASLHQETADVLDKSFQTANVAKWAVESRAVLIQTDPPHKGNVI